MKNIRLFLAILFIGSSALSITTCAGPVQLTGMVVSPANPNIPAGVTQQFTAIGLYSDSTRQGVTSQITWSSSNTSVATINSSGLATAVAVGTTTITASTPSHYPPTGQATGTTILTVTPATLSSIVITPTNPSIPVGLTPQFTAIGIYSDGTSHDITTQVTWGSSNTSVATVTSGGLVTVPTGVAAGSAATITATLGSISGSTTLAVATAVSSITITPTNPSTPVGLATQFTATVTSGGTTLDITTQVAWSSSNTSAATVDSSGLATAVVAGTATITATLGSISGSATLTVTAATLSSISVTPANPSIPVGLTPQFTATGTYSDGTTFDITTQVTWGSSNTPVATVTSGGLVTAVAAGTATITATFGSISGSTTLTVTSATLSSISVTPANLSIAAGGIQQFTATGTYSDGTNHDITTQVTWSASNSSVARVSNSGLATAVAAGTAAINASSGIIPGSTILTVTSG